jgi:hypothetical protein
VPGRSALTVRAVAVRLLAAGVLAGLVGCALFRDPPPRQLPLPAGRGPNDLIDADQPAESIDPLDPVELVRAAERVKLTRKPAKEPEKKYNFLVISGGAVYGAYSSGVLIGMTQAGKRPEFDVVTGISVGALIAAITFLGPENDPELERQVTAFQSEDYYTYRRSLRQLFSESVADNSPLRRRAEQLVTMEYLAKVAAEHKKGRRLYIGSTNLDTKRLVIWDMGAIASRGTPEARCLYIDCLMASSAVPGFFPSVRFNTTVDGQAFEELHVDGGVSRAIFFRLPYVPPAQREAFGVESLYGSNLYALVAGKLYADPAAVKPRTFAVAGAAIGSLLYSQTRGDLFNLFTLCLVSGMNFKLSAIPQDLPVPASSTTFDPDEMRRMFDEGIKNGRSGEAWRTTPPGFEAGEDARARTGTRLSVDPAVGPAKTNAPPTVPGSRSPRTAPGGPRLFRLFDTSGMRSDLLPGGSGVPGLPGPEPGMMVIPAVPVKHEEMK